MMNILYDDTSIYAKRNVRIGHSKQYTLLWLFLVLRIIDAHEIKSLSQCNASSKCFTPSVSKYLSSLIFFTTLTIRLIQKIMLVSFTLLATYFIIVGILNLTYPFTHLG
jgi:hypothetical protein